MIKTLKSNQDWTGYWKTKPLPPDFLVQVNYTHKRQAIETHYIDAAEQAILRALAISSDDVVFDVCCGNGLLTYRIAGLSYHVYGIDFSANLIDVAEKNFQRPNITYLCKSALTIATEDFLLPITKACMNAGLQYFTIAEARTFLNVFSKTTNHAAPLLLTDVPDVSHLSDFYHTPEYQADFVKRRANRTEAIGTWWDKDELAILINDAGFNANFIVQEKTRFCSHYRFDLLALPK